MATERRGIHILPRLLEASLRLLGVVGDLALVFLLLGVSFDVLFRATLGHPVRGIVEYALTALILLAFLPMGRAQISGDHVSFDLFASRLPRRWRGAFVRTGLVVGAALLGSMAWASSSAAWAALQSGEARIGVVGTPMWPARAAVALGFWGLSAQLVSDALKAGD